MLLPNLAPNADARPASRHSLSVVRARRWLSR